MRDQPDAGGIIIPGTLRRHAKGHVLDSLLLSSMRPAPKLDGAIEMLDKLADEVRASGDFDDEEKQQLVGLIEARKQWYPKSGLCRG